MYTPIAEERSAARAILTQADDQPELLDDPDFWVAYTWAKWILKKA